MNWIEYLMICLLGFTLAVYICTYRSRPAEGRDLCVRPPYMMGTNNCSRVPTLAKPYCPAPEGY